MHRPTKCAPVAILSLAVVLLSGCVQDRSDGAEPVVPQGFDVGLLSILACPENLSAVRLATTNELTFINDRIRSKRLKRWNGAPVEGPVEAALIREDKRIAYEVRQGIPFMLISEALVLDDSVGSPNPQKHRKP